MRLARFTGLFLLFALASYAEPQKLWKLDTTLGINLGYQFNQNFLSLQNGQVFSPGFQFEQSVKFTNMPHEWQLDFVLGEAWALTTPQTVFVKTTDNLQIKSSYLFHVQTGWGPYVSAKLRTSIFSGHDLETSVTTYQITDAATGRVWTENSTGSNSTGTFAFALTSPFLPLILEQDAGFFYQPWQTASLGVELRAAVTGRENIAKNQRILTAIGVVYGDTPVRQLDNVYELGPSLGVILKGNWFEKKLTYRLSGDYLLSLLQTPQFSMAATHGQSFDLSAGIGVHVLTWLSLNWQFKAVLNPAILDQVQIMSNLMLAINYSN